ncbi:hypothetical protein [Mycobacterium sp. IS-1556]|uniref:hypothetical protein n=1 Tax=Mycobacterium sp. IS-1556 TaxID=1772276 RepID=UPI00074182CB|nr:hypothetical protein [Mycobacterium sp. IS-1556]KUH84785.1 hypothetical protein AU187_19920 [Mycobacterium sp. IS-1556]
MPDIDEPEVPSSVEHVGKWEMTQIGRARKLAWPSEYSGYPKVDENGQERQDLVRAFVLQGAGGQLKFPGIEINVRGEFSLNEARLVAAAIRALADKIEQEFGDD